MTGEKKTVPLEEAREQVRKVCARLGLLHIAFARTLINELGEEKGKELVLKAIKGYGIRIGEEAKARAEAEGGDNEPANFKSDLPLYGMHAGAETVEVAGETRRRAYGCVMGEVWNEMGEGELGRLYCYVDPAKYMAFNPGYKLIHTRALPDGDDCCELVVRPTTEQERKDFAEKDRDWSYIDR
ncbi:MAG: L-2-amino-thiazoline-4-carboxylic acid hydrolase [Dehalococcoidales bacterium]|nr:L-2-amino-thiazoline-4-carboxylic acid hydrolase [Dehalococcoidales bacterium]